MFAANFPLHIFTPHPSNLLPSVTKHKTTVFCGLQSAPDYKALYQLTITKWFIFKHKGH